MEEMSQFNGLPYTLHPVDMPSSEVVQLLEQALIDHPEDELKILRHLVPYTSSVPKLHQRCLQLADRMLQITDKEQDTSEALYWRATILLETRSGLKEAEDIFLNLYEKEPDHDGVIDQLFELYMHKKQYEKAFHWAEVMCQLEGAEHCGLLNKGEVYLAQERFQEALEAYRAIIPLNTHLHNAYFGMAKSLLATEQHEEACQAFINAFEHCHYPEPLYAYGAGFCYQNIDNPYRAMHWYTKCLDIDPSYSDALNNTAVLSMQLSSGWEDAVPYLLKAVELSNEAINPSMQVVYRNLWAYYTQILDKEKAEYYQRLSYKCLGFDDDSFDFLNSFPDE